MPASFRPIFHLLPNAHLDPVWLWDSREGLNEGLTTIATVLDLMDEHPKLTFLRGEAVIYRHLQREAPDLFRRVRDKIEEGRWDVVGGTWLQPDSNLPSTETLCRQFEVGLAYFQKELNVRPTIAWQADSFGHTAGWPNILHAFGMEGFAFTRPQRGQFPMESPLFQWRGDHENRLLCYRQHSPAYCNERGNAAGVLDFTLKASAQQPWRNLGVLFGLGNHGGGPTRKHLAEVEAWAAKHPEVELRYSTLHGLFAALKAEMKEKKVPEIRGEFGYCLRGCYSAVQKFKSLYRQAEQSLPGAEATESLITGNNSLTEAWEGVLFNSFHDILPGSSIERAMEEQMAWVGQSLHQSKQAGFQAMNALAARMDTRVPAAASPDAPTQVPVLVWNPLPRPFSGPVEVEVSLDYRPLFEYQNRCGEVPVVLFDGWGKALPFQEVATEHSAMPSLPWRKRVVVPLDIPALGWQVLRMGVGSQKITPVKRADATRTLGKGIANPDWEILPQRGGVEIRWKGKNWFPDGRRLQLLVMEDPWGSWGGMQEEPESWKLDRVREEWKLVRSEVLEPGPERARLWTRWEGANSWVELTFDLNRGVRWVSVQGRLLWNERSARLQLVLPASGPATCDVPGGTTSRKERGQTPVGRWFVRKGNAGVKLGAASEALSDADFLESETRLTLARASRYANDVETGPADQPWIPAVDCGELKFRLNLFSGAVRPDHAAEALMLPPVALPVRPGPGKLPGVGSLGELFPATMRLLAAGRDSTGRLKLRVQNRGATEVSARLRLGNSEHALGTLGPQQIVTRVLKVPPEI